MKKLKLFLHLENEEDNKCKINSYHTHCIFCDAVITGGNDFLKHQEKTGHSAVMKCPNGHKSVILSINTNCMDEEK